jgi:hypothetical protein
LAALLHDIGHGPFSHVSDYLLDEYSTKEILGSDTAPEKIHERITIDIVKRHEEIATLLKDSEQDAIVDIIEESSIRDHRRDIVSSTLDADKIDYLLRDTYHTGVKYGIFDTEKVLDSFRVHRVGDESFLVIDEDGLFAVKQLVLAKHHMTQQVYAHRVRVITDSMIVRGLRLAIEDGLTEIERLYSYDGTSDFIDRYLASNDEKIVATLINSSLERPKSLFKRLLDRRLYKELMMLPLDDHSVIDPIIRYRLMELSSESVSKLEIAIAEHIDCQPWEVILQRKNIKTHRTMDRVKSTQARSLSYHGTRRPLSGK